MSRILIVVDPDPGENVRHTAARALGLAMNPSIHALTPGAMPRVQFTHNDRFVHVYPDDSLDGILARWDAAR